MRGGFVPVSPTLSPWPQCSPTAQPARRRAPSTTGAAPRTPSAPTTPLASAATAGPPTTATGGSACPKVRGAGGGDGHPIPGWPLPGVPVSLSRGRASPQREGEREPDGGTGVRPLPGRRPARLHRGQRRPNLHGHQRGAPARCPCPPAPPARRRALRLALRPGGARL